jgi:hypothetical protein
MPSSQRHDQYRPVLLKISHQKLREGRKEKKKETHSPVKSKEAFREGLEKAPGEKTRSSNPKPHGTPDCRRPSSERRRKWEWKWNLRKEEQVD